MFLTRSEYDRGVNTFSPEGRLFQVEYAIEATKLGSTSIGVRTHEGVVLAAEKRVTTRLMIGDSIEKVSKVDEHIAVAYAGLIADSRTLVDRAQLEAQNYWFTYDRKIKVEALTHCVANLALQFGDDDAQAAMSRPFGVSLLFAGLDQDGPRLYHLDPSGTYIACAAKAIGAASDGAEQNLKEQYHETMTLVGAEKMALSILKQVMEEKLTSSNVEIVTITPSAANASVGEFRRLKQADIEQLITDL